MSNPFTGDIIELPVDDGLTTFEREAVRSLLSDYSATPPDDDRFCRIAFSDGSHVNVAIGTLNDDDLRCVGFAVEGSAATLAVARFVLELATRAHVAIRSTMDRDYVVVPFTPTPDVVKRWPTVQVVRGADNLWTWLKTRIDLGAT